MAFFSLSNATNCSFPPIAVLQYKFEIVNLSMDHPAYKQPKQQIYVLYFFKYVTLFFPNFWEILVSFLTIYKLFDLLLKFLTFSKFSKLVDTITDSKKILSELLRNLR